jgi:predicted outer membrane repeat protein
MQGAASVSGNTASSPYGGSGGGVMFSSRRTFTMQDNASVSGNTASSIGGGVSVTLGTFTMQDNALVSGNTASSGGGVSVGTDGTFTMEGSASVSGNTASSDGGGVYVSNFAFVGSLGTAFIKKGGTIYGDTDTTHTAGSDENTASSGNGHAVYLHNDSKKRNSTAGTTVNLYAKYIDGAWTYNDTSSGGVGDTTANWE